MTRRWTAWSVAGGVAAATIYALTPVTVCVVIAAAVVLPLFGAGLSPRDRRWLTIIVCAAVVVRVLIVGGMFLRNIQVHDDQFVGATSGDEAYAMSRALRMRDIVRGWPTTKYDYFVAYDEYGRNSFTAALTGLQLIFGPTPYSLRLLNALLFLCGALLLFRVAYRAFGRVAAFGGLLVVLFWPSLFVWSISLLKEPLYFLCGAVAVTCAVTIGGDPRWRVRAACVAATALAWATMRDLRPAALVLAVGGLATGILLFIFTASKRAALVAVAGAIGAAVMLSLVPPLQRRVVAGVEAAAKVQMGHVFTVGHAYKLLDAGFYVKPATPAASSLTLRADEAARFVVRGLLSFVLVPLPWDLQSARELAYLPEQLAWYALVVLMPLGAWAALGRGRLAACMLMGYAAPTAVVLALTNGNVGTLLRLRGLVIPFVAWLSIAGIDALMERSKRLVDERGRVFGRVNLFDATLIAFAIAVVPIAYGTYLLFRPPALRIESVERVPITREERRVTGGSTLTAKLKVRGTGLRPMLRAMIDDAPALAFVFEDPHSADVLVGEVPAGAHDLILFDGVQEVARTRRAVTIQSERSPQLLALGVFAELHERTARSIAAIRLSSSLEIVKVGPQRPDANGRWQRDAEMRVQCDPDPAGEGCVVGGFLLNAPRPPTLWLAVPSGEVVSFAVNELLPNTPPQFVTARVRLASAPEPLALVRVGDRDDILDERAATVIAVGSRHATDVDVTIGAGLDQSRDGRVYRGRAFKAGAPFRLSTDRYVLEGVVLEVGETRQGESK